ncbi:MAG: redoxin domain-containing protein, partial [Pseudomonadales bacterium]
MWQQRDLLSDNEAAPQFELAELYTGKSTALVTPGKPTLLYFFAPWCTVCKLSIGNLAFVTEDIQVAAIALDYRSIEEVADFIDGKELSVPVLLGTSALSKAYK